MISRIQGKLFLKSDSSVTIEVNGLFYEVLVPQSVLSRLENDVNGNVSLITYHYVQTTPAGGFPVLVGFLNEIERDFFLQFITVSGIGPKAAIRALSKPISETARAINEGDITYLKTLPGIGMQRAKEVVAKLQGKVGKFGLIQDKGIKAAEDKPVVSWQEEALEVLIQLQYKRNEAQVMIEKALKRVPGLASAEDLLNEIYKQRINP